MKCCGVVGLGLRADMAWMGRPWTPLQSPDIHAAATRAFSRIACCSYIDHCNNLYHRSFTGEFIALSEHLVMGRPWTPLQSPDIHAAATRAFSRIACCSYIDHCNNLYHRSFTGEFIALSEHLVMGRPWTPLQSPDIHAAATRAFSRIACCSYIDHCNNLYHRSLTGEFIALSEHLVMGRPWTPLQSPDIHAAATRAFSRIACCSCIDHCNNLYHRRVTGEVYSVVGTSCHRATLDPVTIPGHPRRGDPRILSYRVLWLH
ncbi:hypothetical protein J6590_008038 [Homalodisca vitripennis]|nr:hypothetical protein J6590_008038 [Homalodisca vitripennis]